MFKVYLSLLALAVVPIAVGTTAHAQAPATVPAQFGVVDVNRVANESKSRQQIAADLDRTQRTFTQILQRLGQGSARFLNEAEIKELAALYEKDKATDVEQKRRGALEEKGDQIRREMTTLQTTAAPDAAQTARYQQLQDSEQAGKDTFQKLNRDLSARLQDKVRDAETKSLAAIRTTVAKIAKAKNLSVVFTGEFAIYATVDITEDVIKEVNK